MLIKSLSDYFDKEDVPEILESLSDNKIVVSLLEDYPIYWHIDQHYHEYQFKYIDNLYIIIKTYHGKNPVEITITKE